MATTDPLIHDGSNFTAASDFTGTAALNGLSSTGQYLAVKISTARKLILASSGGEFIYGILQNKPAVGQAADVGIMGLSKAVAGAQVTGGNFLMTDTSGRLIPATGTNSRIAIAVEDAAAAGVVFTVAIVPGALGRNVT